MVLLYPLSPLTPLPSAASITPSYFTLSYSSPPLYLVSLFPVEACCFQVQVAGCNLSSMSPSPFCTQVFPEPAPMFTFPSPYLASSRSLVLCVSFLESALCVLYKLFHLCRNMCLHAVLVNDPPFLLLPSPSDKKCMSTHSLHSITYLCQPGQDAEGEERGGGMKQSKANFVVTVKAGIRSARTKQARKE